MHDPFLSSLRLNWIEIAYFYLLLPMVVNRCHCERDRMKLWRILTLQKKPHELPPQLIEARKRFDRPRPEHFIYRGKEKVNRRALEIVDDAGVQEQIVAGAELRDRYTRDVLAQLELAGV
jgi:hypothetical protein